MQRQADRFGSRRRARPSLGRAFVRGRGALGSLGGALALVAALVGPLAAGQGSGGAIVPPGSETRVAAGPAPWLYVCVQDEAKVAVVDMATLEVARVIDLTKLGFSRTAKPHHIAVEPDGAHWYVSLIGENRVVRFDRDGNLVGQYETATPGMLAFHPAHELLMASRSMSAVNPPSRVSVLGATDMEGDEIEVLFPRPHPMVVTGDGRWAYTGSLGVNQIAAIDLESEEVTITEVAGPPHAFVQFALSPDDRTMVATTELSGRLMAWDLADPANPALLADVDVGPKAFDPIYAPDGRSVWVPVKGANQLAIVDVETWSVVERLEAPSLLQPHAILFSPDGRHAFVSNNNTADHMAGHADAGTDAATHPPAPGNVTVIEVETRKVVKVLELGPNVTGMGRAQDS